MKQVQSKLWVKITALLLLSICSVVLLFSALGIAYLADQGGYVKKKDELLDAVNTGSGKKHGALWYNAGRYIYVPMAVILCCVALFMNVAF